MNKNNGYRVENIEAKIYITKKFAKAASQIGSYEFELVKQLRKDFPDYKFEYREISKNDNKRSYNGLSIDEMRRFIEANRSDDLELFEKVVAVAAAKRSKYAAVKKWFLDNYKDAYNTEIENIKISESPVVA